LLMANGQIVRFPNNPGVRAFGPGQAANMGPPGTRAPAVAAGDRAAAANRTRACTCSTSPAHASIAAFAKAALTHAACHTTLGSPPVTNPCTQRGLPVGASEIELASEIVAIGPRPRHLRRPAPSPLLWRHTGRRWSASEKAYSTMRLPFMPAPRWGSQ